MNEEQRADFAQRLEMIRLGRYKGSRLAAYTDVKINSGTWTRAEAGQTMKETSVATIVAQLWPETGGDWRRIVPPLGGGLAQSEIESSPEIAKMIAEVQSWDIPEKTKRPIIESLQERARATIKGQEERA